MASFHALSHIRTVGLILTIFAGAGLGGEVTVTMGAADGWTCWSRSPHQCIAISRTLNTDKAIWRSHRPSDSSCVEAFDSGKMSEKTAPLLLTEGLLEAQTVARQPQELALLRDLLAAC